MKKYAEFFCDLAAQDYVMRGFKPSVVASASIMCARKINHVVPIWNKTLEELTSYKYEQIERPAELIMRFFN